MMAFVAMLVGVGVGALASLVPGLHVYMLCAGLVLLSGSHAWSALTLVPCVAGMLSASVVFGTIPSVLLGAADDSLAVTTLPSQKFLQRGWGHEAVILVVLGAGAAGLILVSFLATVGPTVLSRVRAITHVHAHWMVWCVIVYMLQAEWPREGRLPTSRAARLREAWGPLGAGLLTFFLSGLVGIVIMYHPPLAPDRAFQSLMPALAGLFTVPWLLIQLTSGTKVPQQTIGGSGVSIPEVMSGSFTGALGGGFAAILPGVTGGVGSMLAGQVAGMNGDRMFLVAQGAARCTYLVGSFLLMLVPGLWTTRGGAARMVGSITDMSVYDGASGLERMLALTAFALALSLALASPTSRLYVKLLNRVGCRALAMVGLGVTAATVLGMTGWVGVTILVVCTGIGFLPILFGSRRLNCLGLILLPVALQLSGLDGAVYDFLFSK